MVEKPRCQPTIAYVRQAFTRPLPGLSAQLRMVPSYPDASLRYPPAPPGAKDAGVLILLYPMEGKICFPLTRRTDTVESHKGQVSLPGGARETGESLEATAVRETCEELRACADNWSILGALTPLYIPASSFVISPFVAYSPIRPRFQPDPIEVAELIETPLAVLLDPVTIKRETWTLRGIPVEVPFFHIDGNKVWGATAMVLSELITLLCEGGT